MREESRVLKSKLLHKLRLKRMKMLMWISLLSLRPILIIVETDVSRRTLMLDTSFFAAINMRQRE